MIILLFAAPFVPLLLLLAGWRASTPITRARRFQGEAGYWDEGLRATRCVAIFAVGCVTFVTFFILAIPVRLPELVEPSLGIGAIIVAICTTLVAAPLYLVWARGVERWLAPLALMLSTVFVAFAPGMTH